MRNAWLLIASLTFYSIDGGLITAVLLASIIFNYSAGLAIANSRNKRLLILWVGIATNLVPLFYYKYWTFLLNSTKDLTGLQVSALHVVLPAGISFFTFQEISYLVDIYRREISPSRSVINFGMYHALFPQLIAGPIVRYVEIEDRIEHRTLSITDVHDGLIRFCLGLGKKSSLLTAWALSQTKCSQSR